MKRYGAIYNKLGKYWEYKGFSFLRYKQDWYVFNSRNPDFGELITCEFSLKDCIKAVELILKGRIEILNE